MFEYHTVMRTYGFEYEPYHLPTFLNLSISSMEYSHQIFRIDERHFRHYMNHKEFTLPQEIGLLKIKKMEVIQYLKNLLMKLRFNKA